MRASVKNVEPSVKQSVEPTRRFSRCCVHIYFEWSSRPISLKNDARATYGSRLFIDPEIYDQTSHEVIAKTLHEVIAKSLQRLDLLVLGLAHKNSDV